MAASMKMTVFWDIAPSSLIETDCPLTGMIIAFIMEAVCTSETSVYFNATTWHYIPESCHQYVILFASME
jgi:hypothetical protein